MTSKIGELARYTDTSPPTSRYYEEIDLLPAPARCSGGQRRYGEEDRRRLTFIRQCRAFGFSIEQVRALLILIEDGNRSCTEARAIAVDHLAVVRKKLAELKRLKRNLAEFIRRCDALCCGGPAPDCVILKDMAKSTCGARMQTATSKGR